MHLNVTISEKSNRNLYFFTSQTKRAKMMGEKIELRIKEVAAIRTLSINQEIITNVRLYV